MNLFRKKGGKRQKKKKTTLFSYRNLFFGTFGYSFTHNCKRQEAECLLTQNTFSVLKNILIQYISKATGILIYLYPCIENQHKAINTVFNTISI